MNPLIHLSWIVAVVFLAGCTNADTEPIQEAKQVPVDVLRVRAQPRDEVLRLLGTVEANRDMKIAFKMSGKIASLHFDEGALVQKGSLLAELETTEFLARRQKALEEKNKAERDLHRMKNLFKKRIIPESSYQDARSTFIGADAALKIAEETVASSRITASFSGTITKKYAEIGEVVLPGTPLALLSETDPVLVKAAVPDNFIRKITIGETVHVKVDTYPEQTFTGIINRVETAADPLSRTFMAEIRLPNKDEKLRPGLIARVAFRRRHQGSQVFIPLDCVTGFGSEPAVFIIKDEKAMRRSIKTGVLLGEDVEILEGLSSGDMVVITGQEYLKNNQQVLVVREVVETK